MSKNTKKEMKAASKSKNRRQKYNYLAHPIFALTTLQSYLSSFGFVMYVCPGL